MRLSTLIKRNTGKSFKSELVRYNYISAVTLMLLIELMYEGRRPIVRDGLLFERARYDSRLGVGIPAWWRAWRQDATEVSRAISGKTDL